MDYYIIYAKIGNIIKLIKENATQDEVEEMSKKYSNIIFEKIGGVNNGTQQN